MRGKPSTDDCTMVRCVMGVSGYKGCGGVMQKRREMRMENWKEGWEKKEYMEGEER